VKGGKRSTKTSGHLGEPVAPWTMAVASVYVREAAGGRWDTAQCLSRRGDGDGLTLVLVLVAGYDAR